MIIPLFFLYSYSNANQVRILFNATLTRIILR